MMPQMFLYAAKHLTYSAIEYDYKYCSYRLPEKHKAATGNCTCEEETHGKLAALFFNNAKTLWFMSAAQKDIYITKFPFLDKPTTEVLSSIFDTNSLSLFEKLSSNPKKDVWLIQDSPSWVKGTEEAIKYAESHNLPYETFKDISYTQMLEKFSRSKGFIFLPRGADTCPRTVIEAKMLGCELILNDNVQHQTEEWFRGDKKAAHEYLSSRVQYFWQRNYTHMPYELPDPEEFPLEEATHFKIIVPAFNAEKWISKTIESVQNQDYNNYECIVVDDISNDNTYQIACEKTANNPQFTVIKNKEKKFALGNISFAMDYFKADSQDVVILLDGDDWLATQHTLNQLNKYYTQNDCWMTFGSFVRYPDGYLGPESSAYSPEVVQNSSFRQDDWRASHLKTFRSFLWNQLDRADLQYPEGGFFHNCYDQAIMLPMLEMSQERSHFIPEVLCVYNVGNPNAVNKTKVQQQFETMKFIRSKPSYQRLENENIF